MAEPAVTLAIEIGHLSINVHRPLLRPFGFRNYGSIGWCLFMVVGSVAWWQSAPRFGVRFIHARRKANG